MGTPCDKSQIVVRQMTVGRMPDPAVLAAIRTAGHIQTYDDVRKPFVHAGYLPEMHR